MRQHFQRPLMGISSVQARRFSACHDENNNDDVLTSQMSDYCSDSVGIVYPTGRRLRKRNGVKDDGQHRSLVSNLYIYFTTL